MQGTDIWIVMLHALLALTGGSVREISRLNHGGFNWLSFSGGILVSAFAGVVVFFICRYFATDDWLTAALTSVAGYGGINALDFVTNAIKNKVSTNGPQP